MIERVNELNLDVAVIYANNKLEKDDQVNYEELVQNDEYVLITDPIKRIADMKY